jgi:hypothetical protein
MAKKDRRSRDQKRKAKLSKRAQKQRPSGPLPYTGRKYQTDRWVPHVYQVELAIYEAITLSDRRLTNGQVREALVRLIVELRRGLSLVVSAEEPEVPFIPGQEVEFLVWNIRRHWQLLFQDEGPVSREDLVGILRTLLHSIEAHAWNTGPRLGYVAFLEGFMRHTRGIPAEYYAEEPPAVKAGFWSCVRFF